MNLTTQLESLLFIAGRPLTRKKLQELTLADAETVEQTLKALMHNYVERDSGIRIIETAQGYEMGTAPETSSLVIALTKDETSGELTKPQLETLAIVSYRGPITKNELEEIRGVNCSMILRNLLIRGLVDEETGAENKIVRYAVTHEFVRFLGMNSVSELPDYENLRDHVALKALLDAKQQKISTSTQHETQNPEQPTQN